MNLRNVVFNTLGYMARHVLLDCRCGIYTGRQGIGGNVTCIMNLECDFNRKQSNSVDISVWVRILRFAIPIM
jgi:hypothetical protein